MQQTNPLWLVSLAPGDLKAQVRIAVEKGYHVVSQTQTAAQLMRKKQFSCLVATVLFLCFALPFFLYLFYYLGEKDESIYLDIETQPTKEELQDMSKNKMKQPLKLNFGTFLLIIVVIIFVFGIISAVKDSLSPKNAPSNNASASVTPSAPPVDAGPALKKTAEDRLAELKKFDETSYRSDVDVLLREEAYFSSVASDANAATASTDSDAKKAGQALTVALKKLQSAQFPKMRKVYGDLAGKAAWLQDVTVTVSGGTNENITLVGAIFATNKNIATLQGNIEGPLTRLRFDRVNYKWIPSAPQWTYFDLTSKADDEI